MCKSHHGLPRFDKITTTTDYYNMSMAGLKSGKLLRKSSLLSKFLWPATFVVWELGQHLQAGWITVMALTGVTSTPYRSWSVMTSNDEGSHTCRSGSVAEMVSKVLLTGVFSDTVNMKASSMKRGGCSSREMRTLTSAVSERSLTRPSLAITSNCETKSFR